MSCTTKELVEKFFTEGDNDVWTCRCKTTRKKGRGWANLMDHIQREHEDNLDEAKKKEGGPILQFFTKKDVNQFQWLEWVVKDLLPFSFCEKLTTRKFLLISARRGCGTRTRVRGRGGVRLYVKVREIEEIHARSLS
jgi:hypothetical protein